MELDRDALKFEVTVEECAYLDQMIRTPGWPVMLRVLDGYAAAMTIGAVNVSLQEPLGNKDRMSNAWAYALIARNLRTSLEEGVRREAHRSRDTEETDPETLAAQRLQSTLEAL